VSESSGPVKPDAGDRSVRLRSGGLAWRRAGEEVVVLDLAAAGYHALNASGALLWERLGSWTTGAELSGVLAASYGLTPAAAAADVGRFLDSCSAAGLVEIRAGS
jgi:Coenzyme PQQ synthesis protein D (PqqD)